MRRPALVAMGGIAALALAQNALDNNLRVGSGGVNEVVRPGLQRELYRPAVVRTSGPLSVRSDSGDLVYSPNNAFNPSRPYMAKHAARPMGNTGPYTPYVQTGYSSDRRSQGYQARFRGY